MSVRESRCNTMSVAVSTPHSFLTTGEQDVVLFPTKAELTVAQAAQVLDLPESAILELFSLGVLEYRQEGSQHLLDRDHVYEYKQQQEEGLILMRELMRLSEEMGLYDEELYK